MNHYPFNPKLKLKTRIKNSQTIIQRIQSPSTLLVCGILLLALIIIILRLLFNKGVLLSNPSKSISTNNVVTDVVLLISVLFATFFILVLFLPNMQDFSSFLSNISSSFLILSYTVFLFFILYAIPTDFMEKYSYVMVPSLLLLTGGMFAGSSILQSQNRGSYDRVNTLITFGCFLFTFLLFYLVNPGDYIHKNFGSFALISLLIGIFSLVYLIILFTVPNQGKSPLSSTTLSFTPFNMGLTALFFLFFVTILVGMGQYPGGFFSKSNQWVCLTVFLLLLFVIAILSIFITFTFFPKPVLTSFISSSFLSSSNTSFSKMGLFKSSLLTILGLTVSALIITWIVISIQKMSGTSGIISFVLNALLVILLLGFIYKALNPTTSTNAENRGNKGFSWFLFMIPSLFSDLLKRGTRLFTDQESYQTLTSILLIIVVILLLFGLNTLQKTVNQRIALQGGTPLLTAPISLNDSTPLGSYEELNGFKDKEAVDVAEKSSHNYQYAISFCFYLPADSTHAAYNEYKSLLNYGNKPAVLYRQADNSLLITMQKNGRREIPINVDREDISGNMDISGNQVMVEKIDEYENDGVFNDSLILYRMEKIKLQRWNHLVLNYVNGTLDIFYNGELVKTAVGLVPYLSLDTLTVGAKNGVEGQINEVLYFNKALTLENIKKINDNHKDSTFQRE